MQKGRKMRNLGNYLLILTIALILPLHAADQNATFTFKMQSNKHEVYLGEPVKLTFTFQYPIDLKIAEANFAPPTFHDLWVKTGKNVPNRIKNGYHIYKLDYLITPQRAGTIEIEPARMDIGILKTKEKNTLRFDRVKWKSIFSNAVKLKVKPLPDDTQLFGDYSLETQIDKNSTKANEPVHLTVTVKGSGNVEEIPDFEIKTEHAVVYSDKPLIKTHFEKGVSKGTFTQKFAFVSDRNFTIPALSLTYFDNQSKKVKTVKTEPIPVTIKDTPAANMTPHLEKGAQASSQNYRPLSKTLWLISIIAAFIAGILLTLLFKRSNKTVSKESRSVEEQIKKAKNDKTLLQILLPYAAGNPKIAQIVKQLEENLYEKGRHRVDRKKTAKLFYENVTNPPDTSDILD
jgi:hypothetical protein